MFQLRVAALLALGALDPSGWNAILHQYITPQSRVDYAGLRARGRKNLDAWIASVAAPWPAGIPANEKKAALINAYNALTVRWILENYPVKSIWRTDDPFRKPRHTVDGQVVSLDTIETRLRELGDPRVHAALVCAARSCPPLRWEAYTGARLDEQLDDNTRRWLGNPAVNEFLPEQRTARVSPIFEWYAGDFARSGGVARFLSRFAPEGKGAFLERPDARLEYKDYNWGLNDSGSVGEGYGKIAFYWDWARNGYLFGH
jgi:hypothetical protein